MTNVFATMGAAVAAALKYLPYVHMAVQQVEATAAGAPGSDKKSIALAAVLAAAHAGETVPIAQVQLVSGLIDTVVGVLNATGVFGKATPPAAVVVPAAAAAAV